MWNFLIPFILLLFLVKLIRSVFSSKANKGYWKQYGIPELDASIFVKELDLLLGRRDITERDDHVYRLMGNEKFCGMLEKPSPIILIKDLDLVKKVLIKDFDHFIDRRQFFGAARKDSVLLKMLGNLKGEEWKGVRSSVTPAFTTGKIRRMMEYINSVGKEWVAVLRSNVEKNGGSANVDVFTCASQYTVDVIASAIFGLNGGAVQDPNSTFSTMANRLANMNKLQIIKFSLSLRFPKLFQFFGFEFLDMEAMRFFQTILSQNLRSRMNGDVQRNDFLQLLVEAKNGELKAAEAGSKLINGSEEESQPQRVVSNKKPEKKQYLTDLVLSGQTLSFFFAGFRTTSGFITFAIYCLAVHEDVQEKLRQEVDRIFRDDGSLDYDELGQLVYLDMVVCEILRKFPAALRLERHCIAEYHDPESGVHVPQGTIVGIPLNSIHHDTQFYEKPAEFYPEHFCAQAKAKRNPYAFMPFGMGPRNCIGMRFALVESKAAIARIVHNFVITPTDKTPIPITGRRANFQISPPPGLEVKLTRRMQL